MNTLSEQHRVTLIRMLRTMFPHSSFPSGPYERTAEKVTTAAVANPRLLAQLLQGLDDLDRLRPRPFVELSEETALTLLRALQDTAFFRGVLDIAVVQFYDDHEVWDLLGYEGHSFEKGGYLERGFADLDWLPEPRVTEEETA